MWWCGDGSLFGDRIFYAESTESPWLENGSWHILANGNSGIVWEPSFNVEHFDGALRCDPSVVKVGGMYYMYYSGFPLFTLVNGQLYNPNMTVTTRIGVAYSYDGKHWYPDVDAQSDPAQGHLVINAHTLVDGAYGVSHPSVVYVDGYFYMTFDDTTGQNTPGQYALRSPDPFFQVSVEEWQNGAWVLLPSPSSSHEPSLPPTIQPTTQYRWLDSADNVDWSYAPATREFIVSIDGLGVQYSGEAVARGTHSSIRAFNKELTSQTRPVTHVQAQWIEGPGLVTYSNGSILQDSTCSNYWIRVLRTGRDWPNSSCETDFHDWLNDFGNPALKAAVFDCTDLNYHGFDMGTGASGCRDWATSPLVDNDYDDDLISDPVTWRPSSGVWWTQRSTTGLQHGEQWGGLQGDQPIFGADYDGDFVTDPAVKRGSDFFVLASSGSCPYPLVPFVGTKGCYWSTGWGSADVPLPGDYDGDGKTDIAARNSSSTFQIVPSSGSCPTFYWISTTFNGVTGCTATPGGSGDKPLIADFDGDGKTDVSWHRPTTNPHEVWTALSSLSSCASIGFSTSGVSCYRSLASSDDIPVLGDYDGDEKTDLVWWDSNNYYFSTWGVSSGGCPENFTFNVNHCYLFMGQQNDVPLAKQFNGNTNVEPTIWRPGTLYSDWYTNRTGSSDPTSLYWSFYASPNIFNTQWGLSTDKVEGLR